MRIFYYRATRPIGEENLIDVLQKTHHYQDGSLVKAFNAKGVLYFWSSTTMTFEAVEKQFPGAFEQSMQYFLFRLDL